MGKSKKLKLEEYFRAQRGSETQLPSFQNGDDDNENVAISFQYLQNKYDLENRKLSKDNKIQLLKKLAHITKNTWNQLILQGKKSGFEKLSKSVISNLPSIVTEDVGNLYVLRFASQECRVVGFRQGIIYYILYIDSDLSLYKH